MEHFFLQWTCFRLQRGKQSDAWTGGHIETNSKCGGAGDWDGDGHMHGCVYVDFV